MATPLAASKAPVFSLPQDKLLTLNVNDLPVLRDAAGPGVSFKPLMLDPEMGVWTVLGIFAPGATLPTHLHTGAVHGYTLKGSWIYLEYPEQVQTAGSYLYEPASSIHTFHVPETNTEETVVLFFVSGANVSFKPDGSFDSVLDAITVVKLTEQWCTAHEGVKVPYLRGGSVGYAADAGVAAARQEKRVGELVD
jgi:quercetin dioxygenase-like cupin family protein